MNFINAYKAYKNEVYAQFQEKDFEHYMKEIVDLKLAPYNRISLLKITNYGENFWTFLLSLVVMIPAGFLAGQFGPIPAFFSVFFSHFIFLKLVEFIDWFLWLFLPSRTYNKQKKEEALKRQKMEENIRKTQESLASDKQPDNILSNEQFENFIFLVKKATSNENILTEFDCTAEFIRDYYFYISSNNHNLGTYNKFVNIYVKEIVNLIIENEKQIDNSKAYNYYSDKIVSSLRNLQVLVKQEHDRVTKIGSVNLESSFTALENMMKQDGLEDLL